MDDPSIEPAPASQPVEAPGASSEPDPAGDALDAPVTDHDVAKDGDADPTGHYAHLAGVVGVGTSAGGLEPLQRFFEHLPLGSDLAFVVIQHLSPDFKSLMRELLARHTRLEVVRAEDRMLLKPETVHLLPPKKNMILQNGRLRLLDQDLSSGHRLNLPIDMFFNSLAAEVRDRAIAVVLSGSGSDGASGIREIHERGGMVMVQDPQTAQFDGMPRSAIATGLADHVLAPDEMARVVYDFIRNPLLPAPGGDAEATGRIATEDLDRIAALLGQDGELDFTHYKPSTIARRIERRMVIRGYADLNAYIEELNVSVEARTTLRNDLLINVTSFFRDPPVWDVLRTEIVPRMVASVEEDQQLRIWVTACASGEEAYSMAMLVADEVRRADKHIGVKIFATDVDSDSIERASQGIYPQSIAAEVGEQWLKRYFAREGDNLHVRRELREMIIFARHNLIKDPPFTRMNLVTCRNALIYMQPDLQRRVLSTLHFAIRPRGVLLLGSAETLGPLENEFTTLHRRWKVYEKRRDTVIPLGLTAVGGDSHRDRRERSGGQGSPPTPAPTLPMARAMRPEAIVDEVLRATFRDRDTTCLVVSSDGVLLKVFGRKGDRIALPEGNVTLDAVKLVARPLATPLSSALHRARTTGDLVEYNGIRTDDTDAGQHVNLRVTYHSGEREGIDFFVVIIEEARVTMPLTGEGPDLGADAIARMADLENELQQTRENLQATIEELETTNEEQQATNEELLASNEELQSTNEELHSVNEELYTVNAEHQVKIQELTELNNDVDNLLLSTDIGVIFLDERLRIRKFTPAIAEVIHIREQDLGRPIQEIAFNVDDDMVLGDVQQVLSTGAPTAREIATARNRTLLMRIHPYRTGGDEPQGVVLTFVDTSELRRVETELDRVRELTDTVLQTVGALVYVLDARHRVVQFNDTCARVAGRPLREVEGESIWDLSLIDDRDRRSTWNAFERLAQNEPAEPYEARWRNRDGERRLVTWTNTAVRQPDGALRYIVGCGVDITERRRAELDALRKSVELEEFYTATPVGLASLDVEGRYQRLNARIAEIQGATIEACIGHTVREISPALAESLDPLINRILQGGSAEVDAELQFSSPALDGDVRDWLATVYPIHQEQGGIQGVGVVLREITEIKSIQRALGSANEDLRRKNEEMEQFVYTVSHDLKSPLVTIALSMGIARDRLNSGDAQSALAQLQRAEHTAVQMQAAINDLLQLSRLGRVEHRFEPAPLGPVVQAVLDHFADRIQATGAQVVIQPDLPTLRADRKLLLKTMTNLIGNALLHAGGGDHGRLRLEIGAVTSEREHRVFVRDNGPGIDPRYLERVFDLFQRFGSSSEGTGVGLTIVRRAMAFHDGEAFVESAKGRGATFWLVFPRVPAPAEARTP